MVRVEELIRYLPKLHGEHGVDATLHRLARNQSRIHEVFSNPPGGSWTQFDILRPSSDEVYRWDHMPRVPEAKRPDLVLQFNEGEEMNFILIESKQTISDIYAGMGTSLTEFFTGSGDYLGLKNRPAWHRRCLNEERWRLITPDDEDLRYWFKTFPESLVHYWPGFTFALNPEHIESKSNINTETIITQNKELMDSHRDLHIVVLIGWHGDRHEPFAVRTYSEEFCRTSLAYELDALLEPILLG